MKTIACNLKSIESFLADQLSDDQQEAFERHLDTCTTCCAALQERTADAVLWNDARLFLSSAEALLPDNKRATDSISGSYSGKAEHRIITAPAFLQLDFLAPTDDPHMLGRYAGYEISGVIGYGGMGIVLKGFDSALNRYAAIKVLAPHYASSGAARQRFAREAQAAAAVVHDNVIAIHGVAEYNGLPYLVMPYVKGVSLQKRIDKDGPLSVPEILRIAMQISKGLTAAHDQGLVHRDIKPGNILLPENVERVLITDFGLARAADDASLTRSGVIAGTPQYMSPEQAKGEGIDHRSDLFSLGSVMYAMATGHPPFRAETPYGILRRITDNPHRPVLEIRSDVPPWLCSVIDRLLAKNASDRFASAEEIAALLEDCLAHVQQPSRVPLPASLKPTSQAMRHLRRPAIATGILLTCAAIVLFIVPTDQNKPDNSSVAKDPKTLESADHTSDGADHQDHLSPADDELQWSVDSDLDDLESTLQRLREETL